MDVNGTTWVVLGLLALRPMSGYEMKQVVDRSTRFFWAASYGQIYPELGRLEAAGLVEGTSEPRGGRKRRVFRATAEGRDALRTWLLSPEAIHEVRDEALLKLFFASALEPGEVLDVVRALRRGRQQAVEQLREIQARIPAGVSELAPSLLCLDYGIGVHEWTIEWCDRTERRLEAALSTQKEAQTQ